MAINPSDNSSTKPVEITIRAKDEAKEVIRGTEVAFAKLRAESSALSKSLTLAGDSLKTVTTLADVTRIRVTEASRGIIGVGVAVTGALGGAIAKLIGLTSVIGGIKQQIETNAVAKSFISVIQAQAEEALNDVADLSDILKNTSIVANAFGTGFTQEILRLDTRPISQKIDEGIREGVRGIGKAVFAPFEQALGFSVISSTQRAIGIALQELDQGLAQTAINNFFDATIGKGVIQDLIKGIATSPEIAKFSPQFIQSLLGGSTAGAIDALVKDVSGLIRSQIPSNSPLAQILIGTGFQGTIEGLASTEVRTVFERLNENLADLTLDSSIGQIVGNQFSSDLIKGVLKNPLIKNILRPAVQALAEGSFTDAVISIAEQNLSSGVISLVEKVQKLTDSAAFKGGVKIASRLFDGVDEETKRRNARARGIVGDALNGIGDRFLTGLGIGDSISVLSDSRGLSINIANAVTSSLLDSIAPGLGTAFDLVFDSFGSSIADLLGIQGGQIQALAGLDQALRVGAGQGIDIALRPIANSIVNNAVDVLLDGFRQSGSQAIANGFASFFPGYLRITVANSIQKSGISTAIFDAIINNLDPSKLPATLTSLDGVLVNVKNTVNSGLSAIDEFIQKVQAGILSIPSILPNIQRGALVLIGQIDVGLRNIQNLVSSIFAGIKQGITLVSGGLTSGLTNVSALLERLKNSVSSGGLSVFIGQIQSGVDKATTAIGFLQQKLLAIADSGLNFSVDGIEQVRGLAQSVGSFIQSINTNVSQEFANNILTVYNALDTLRDFVGASGNSGAGQFLNQIIQDTRNTIQSAIPLAGQLQDFLNTQAQAIRDVVRNTIGDAAESFGQFINGFITSGTGQQIASQAQNLLTPFINVFNQVLADTGQRAGRSFLSGFLGSGFDRIAPALNVLDKSIIRVFNSLGSVTSRTSQALDIFSAIPGTFAGFNEPLAVFGYLENIVGSVAGGVSFLTERLTFFTQGLASLQELTQNGPFRLLIGQTVELREQLLATQASLVGTSKILNSFTGKEIVDPVEAIQSLDLPIKNQIELLRKESLELVGVTSKDLVPLFQQVAQRITSIGGSLSDARALSLDFAASLGTLNIPLFQSQQEIGSILSGQIDQNSALAKNLNISNDQVNNWKAQGKLVEELRKRLEAFRQGNKIASETFGGFTSNIQEIFDEIGRAAGESLIDPLVNQLGEVYKFLETNQQQLVNYFQQFSQYFLRIGSAISQVVKQVAKSLQGLIVQAPIYLFRSLTNAVEAFANAITFTIQVLEPVINTLTAMAGAALSLGGPLLQLFLTTKALSTSVSVLGDVFGTIAQLIPGLGELLFLLDVRSSGLVNQFTNLSSVLGVGASGFLLLGKNLESIPGAVGILNQALGPLGGLLAGFIPTIAGVGIQLAGLVAIFPALGAFFSNLITLSPALVTALGGLAASNSYLAPLAPLFSQAADKLSLYADASTRAEVIGKQFTTVLQSVGKAAAANVISLGLLAGGVYAAFVIFDNLVLKNEAVREILSAVGEGLAALGDTVKAVFGNPFTAAIAASALLGTTIAVGLIPPIKTLIGLQLGTWALAASGAIGGLANVMKTLGAVKIAGLLFSSATGFQALSIFAKQGAVASAQFLATNQILVPTLSFLPPSLAAATTGLSTFAVAAWAAVAPFLPLIAVIGGVVAAIAGIGLAVQKQKLAAATEEVEIYRQQLEATGNQSIELAQKLKKAGDIQKEANEKGVRLSDEQYKANQRLLNQSKNQIILLQEQIKTRQAALAETEGDGNKAALEQQIKDLEKQIELLQNLSGDAIQIAPKDLKDKGSAFEQLEKKIQGAKDALASPSGDEEVFKNKANELIEFTQKQLELGNITAEEARRNLALVANNTKVDQETRTKAQQAITESFKNESAKRVDILKAEFDLINAQLAAGQLNFAKNAEEIANLQNSVLEERQQEEQKAHQAALKRIEEEYQARKFVLEQEAITLKNKAKEKPGTQESKDAIARAEQINKELVELEQKKNQDLNNQTKNNAATNQAIANQIAQNKATQAKLGAELEKQVRSGAISEEEAALRQSGAVKKAELDTQLASTKAAYENSRAAIALQFQQDVDKLDKELQEAQSKADKLPENTKEFQQAQDEIVRLQTKYAGLRDARETALGKADQQFEAESKKVNAQVLQNQADTQKKQRDAAIKFLDSRQKEAQDILQKSQNAQLINLQKLENEGINIRAESEFEKTKLSRDQIDEQLRQEQERLKKLQSLPKPENQQEQIQLDAQIRASRLKTQELIRQGLENEAKAYESQIQAVRDRIQIENTLAETNLQRQYLKGKALRSQIEVESAESKVRELETALALETKNIEKRAALEAELEQARIGLADARVAATRDRIQVENTIVETGLQRQYRTGQILRSKAEIETARGKVREIQAALRIETQRTKERVALEAELEQALTALLDAEVRERQELIDTQNQEYLNQIEEQNQAIKQQSVLYEVLSSALEIRNKLLETTKNLTQAAANFVTSELDALSKLESSEYRRKQIAEITAAVKLEALRKQQEFERESLEIQIQQNKLALEREAIQNRINQAAKIGEIAKEVAEIESLKADPRNNNRAGQEQIRARELAVQAKQFELVQLGVQGELIGSQLNNQETLANFQRRSQELNQKGQERQAQVELINSLPAGRRQRAQRALRQRILEESFGFDNSREFRNAGLSLSRGIVQRETGIVPTVDVLSGIDPELGGLLENLSGSQGQSAIADVRKTFDSKFGGTASFSGIESANPTGKPLQLLPEFQGRLTLPSPGDRGAVLGLEKTGSLFNVGVDKLIKFLDGKDGVKGGTNNYNINISAPTGTAKASGNGTTPSLENVLRLAKQTAGIR